MKPYTAGLAAILGFVALNGCVYRQPDPELIIETTRIVESESEPRPEKSPLTYLISSNNGEYSFAFTNGDTYIITKNMFNFIKKHAPDHQKSALVQIESDELSDQKKEYISRRLYTWLRLADTNRDKIIDDIDKKTIVDSDYRRKSLGQLAEKLSEAIHNNK